MNRRAISVDCREKQLKKVTKTSRTQPCLIEFFKNELEKEKTKNAELQKEAAAAHKSVLRFEAILNEVKASHVIERRTYDERIISLSISNQQQKDENQKLSTEIRKLNLRLRAKEKLEGLIVIDDSFDDTEGKNNV